MTKADTQEHSLGMRMSGSREACDRLVAHVRSHASKANDELFAFDIVHVGGPSGSNPTVVEIFAMLRLRDERMMDIFLASYPELSGMVVLRSDDGDDSEASFCDGQRIGDWEPRAWSRKANDA